MGPSRTIREAGLTAARQDEEDFARLADAVDALTLHAGRLERPPPGPPQAPPALRRLLVAVDPSPASRVALAWARRMAPLWGAEVRVATVVPPAGVLDHYLDIFAPHVDPRPPLFPEEVREGRVLLRDAAADLKAAGIAAETSLLEGAPVHQLVREADAFEADLVILGHHPSGPVGRFFLGSVAEGVQHHVPASVLVARTDPPPRHVLMAVDGSRASKRAAYVGYRMARAWGAPATLLHVADPPFPATPAALRMAYHRAEDRVDLSWARPSMDPEVAFGDPAHAILGAAQGSGSGLVAMGCRGLSGFASLVAGSVSARVAREASASVLLLKTASDVAAGAAGA